MMMLNKKESARWGILSLGAGMLWGLAPMSPAQANDHSVLCSNRQMNTQVALTTPEYFAAICSRGYQEQSTGCYVPTEYSYVGQSRSTKETLTVPRGSIEVSQQPPVTVYKATEYIYTYQIATSGPQTLRPWRSLSIFENGRRIYHHRVNHYFGDRGCRPQDRAVSMPSPSFRVSSPNLEPFPEIPDVPLVTPRFDWPQEEVYLPSQRLDEQIEDYSRQIAADPDHVEAYLARGNRNYELKRYQEAIADYEQVIRLQPDRATAHFNQGVSYYRANNPEEAAVSFNAAIRHTLMSDPQSPLLAWFYNNLGVVQRERLPIEQASSVFLEAIKVDPNYALPYYNRGLLMQSFRGNEGAIADYTEAIRLSPFFVMAYFNRGRAYYDYHLTATDYEVNTVDAITGEAIDNTENYQQAIADYTAVTNLDPTNAIAYFQRGIVHYRMKDYDRAIADFTQAIALDDDYLDAYTNLGIAYAEGKHDYGRAIFYFGRTQEKNPQYAPGYYNLAVGYAALTPDNSGLIDGYYQKAIALDRQYESDYYQGLSQQHYAFQDDYELIPALAEIIVPSAVFSPTNPIE